MWFFFFLFFFFFPRGPQLSHLIHVFVCVYEWGCILMHALASWQNVGHGGSPAAWHALARRWPKSHSLQYYSVSRHPISPRRPPPPLYCVFIFFHSECLLETHQPLSVPFPFHANSLASFFILLLFFWTSPLFISYFILALCLFVPRPCLI